MDGCATGNGIVLERRVGRRQGQVYTQESGLLQILSHQGEEKLCCWGAWDILLGTAKGSTLFAALLVAWQWGTGLIHWVGVMLKEVLWQSVKSSFLEVLSLTQQSLTVTPGGTLFCVSSPTTSHCAPLTTASWLAWGCQYWGSLSHLPLLSHTMGKDVVLHCLNTFTPSG